MTKRRKIATSVAIAIFLTSLSFLAWGQSTNILLRSGTSHLAVRLWMEMTSPGYGIDFFATAFGFQENHNATLMIVASAAWWALCAFIIVVVVQLIVRPTDRSRRSLN